MADHQDEGVPGDLDETAARQHGLLSLEQLRTLGMGRGRQRAQGTGDRWTGTFRPAGR